MSNIIEECKRFLSKDREDFQNHNFKHAQFLVDILPELKSGDKGETFEELEDKERNVDQLVSKIVHERAGEFASLINKPMIYGEKYDNIKKTVSTSRKRIKRAGELLSKKNNNLKGYLFNSVHNKEILTVLEKVEKCNSLFIQIDALMKNESFYEMSLSILNLRKEIESFDPSLRDCAVIKHIQENERYKTQEAFNLIQRFIRRFFFFFEYEIAIKSYSKANNSGFRFDKINLEAGSNLPSDNVSRRFLTMNQIQTETFNDLLLSDYGVDLEAFKHFETKINQIRIILQSTPKNYVFDYVEDEYFLAEPEVFESVHILKYIGFSLEVNQFNKYLELICKAEDLLDQESFSSTRTLDIMNLFLAMRSAELTKILPQVFSEYYGNMRKNVHDSMLLIQMFLIKNVWMNQKDEPEPSFFDGDETSQTLYHNLTMVQDYSSLLSLTTLGETAEKVFTIEKRRDLLALYNYNPNTTRNLIQLFKEILMFQTIFIRKNVLFQLMVTNLKENTSNLPIINIKQIFPFKLTLLTKFRATWKEFILELELLFDQIFMFEKIDFEKFGNPKERYILFEASLLPGSPFYDDMPRSKRPSEVFSKGDKPSKHSLLNDFMIQKLIDLLGINFMYIPFILSVIHKPIMVITQQINTIYNNTPIHELFQDQQTNDLAGMDKDVIRFFEENINRYLLLFKLEYVKFIFSLFNTDKKAALQPERNLTLVQDNTNSKLQVKTPPNKASGKDEEKKSPTKEENSKDNLRESDVDLRASTKSDASTKSETPPKQNESIDYAPVDKKPRRAKFDVRGSFLKLKYTILALGQVSNNVNLLPSISIYLPSDKGSHMLDLLNWSMNIVHMEYYTNFRVILSICRIGNHLKAVLKGRLVEKDFNDSKEAKYMVFDEGLHKYNAQLEKSFPFLKRVDQSPSMKDHLKQLKDKYKAYLAGELTISKEENLITDEKHFILVASVIENLEVFLKACDHVFWNLLIKIPIIDIINVVSEKVSGSPQKADKGQGQARTGEETKDAIERLKAKVESLGLSGFLERFQTILANTKEVPNIYRQIPEETGEVGIIRYFSKFNQIYELIRKCIVCLKQELHFRAFCHLIRQGKRPKISMENNPLELTGHSFTNLYRDIFAVYDPLKNTLGNDKIAIIFNDFLNIISKIIKRSFIRSDKISRPYIKTYLQNVLSLEMNLKKLDAISDIWEGKDNPIINIKKFLGLFLLDEKEVLNLVKKTKNKIKPKRIELYIKVQNKANEIKLDQKQEMERMNAINELAQIVTQSKEQPKTEGKTQQTESKNI